MGVPLTVILYGADTLTGLPPTTLSPVGSVPVTRQDFKIAGAPLSVNSTVAAVLMVALILKVSLVAPDVGDAALGLATTFHWVAPATEL